MPPRSPRWRCDMVLNTDAIVGGVHFFPDDPLRRRGAAREPVRRYAKAISGLLPRSPCRMTREMAEARARLGADADAYGCPPRRRSCAHARPGHDIDRRVRDAAARHDGPSRRRASGRSGRGDRHDRGRRTRTSSAARSGPGEALAARRAAARSSDRALPAAAAAQRHRRSAPAARIGGDGCLRRPGRRSWQALRRVGRGSRYRRCARAAVGRRAPGRGERPPAH